MTKKIFIDEAVVKQTLEWIEDATVVLSHTSTAIQGGLGAEAEGVGGCSVRVLKDLREALVARPINVSVMPCGSTVANVYEAYEAGKRTVQQQAAEPVGEGSERQFALREAHRSHFADQYFKARPQIDFLGNRRLFESGFDRGWDAKQIPASASPVSAGWYCAHCQRGVDPSEVTYNEAHTECGRIITDDVAPPPAPTQQPVKIGPLARRRIFDYIRGAYDLGYNDARNVKAVPGDGAPGYKGRDVEADHGGALLHALEALGVIHD